MILGENLREAFRSLMGAKQRTILALIGIIIGIGSVIAMVSIGTIVQHEVLKQFKDMGTDVITIRKEHQGGRAGQSGGAIGLGAAVSIPESCPAVKSVAPYVSVYGTLRYAGQKMNIPALGVTNSFSAINKLNLLSGRFISDLDVFMYYCVVSRKVADRMAAMGEPDVIGREVVFKEKVFTVVGVVDEIPMGGMRPYEINEGIMVPVSTSLRLGERAEISAIMARLSPGAAWQDAEFQIQDHFARTAKGVKVRVQSAEELIERMQQQMRMFTLLLGAIGSISLIVGGVGVMNVMLVSVSERKKEIGIRRALGAQRTDIQAQFLIESIMLCLAGGILGIGFGVGASYVVSRFQNWEFMVSTMAMLLGVGVSCAIGVFFGFYPARQAARLNPIDALRAE